MVLRGTSAPSAMRALTSSPPWFAARRDSTECSLRGCPPEGSSVASRSKTRCRERSGQACRNRGRRQRFRHAWLDSYLDRVLERDATLLPSGGQPRRLHSVLLAANQGGELVKARIA